VQTRTNQIGTVYRIPPEPANLRYQGKLTNAAGAPVANGAYTLVFKFYDGAASGGLLWASAGTVVTTEGGLFTAVVEGVPYWAFRPTPMPIWRSA